MKTLLTVAEAAEMLSLGRSKVYQEIGAGRIRAIKIGRATRIEATEVDAYVRRLREEQEGEVT